MTSCGCVHTDVVDGRGEIASIIDTTDCKIHPVECEALHPVTGINCQHSPGHRGMHSYLATWSS